MLSFVVTAALVGGLVPLLVQATLYRRLGQHLAETLGAAGLVVEPIHPALRGVRARWGRWRLRVSPSLTDRRQLTLGLDAPLSVEFGLQIHFSDEAWSVLGDPALAAALASARLRAAVGPGDQLHLGDGALSLLVHDPARVAPAALALLELAERLERPGLTVAALLEEVALADPDPRARAEATPHLLTGRPEHEAALARDPAPEVRLAVARVVGGERGFAVAREILTSEMFRPDLQQLALRHLRSRYPGEAVGPVLVDALATAGEDLIGALVTALGAIGHEDAGRALYAALPTAELGNAARIAEALAALEGASAEPALLALLERLPESGPRFPDETDLACAVADALGRVGTAASLPALTRLGRGQTIESPVGISTQVALDLIRTRTGGPSLRGALALSGDPETGGHLSAPQP